MEHSKVIERLLDRLVLSRANWRYSVENNDPTKAREYQSVYYKTRSMVEDIMRIGLENSEIDDKLNKLVG